MQASRSTALCITERTVRFDLRDVGIVTEFGGDVDRLEHLVTIFLVSGMLTERETERDRQNVAPEQLCAPAWSAEVRAAQLHVQ